MSNKKVKVLTEEVETQEEVLTEEVETRTFVDGQFTVKANLKHNGKTYKVGDSITLDASEAESLLADGTIG